jgi:hypothetical protein
MHEDKISSSAEELEGKLWDKYQSPLISGDDLRRALGYTSMAAMKQAITRGHCPVPLFSIKHRRGKFALICDIAKWLEKCHQASIGKHA